MTRRKALRSLGLIATGLLLSLAMSSLAMADDDPSIKGELRQNIQSSMKNFIRSETIDGAFYLYDPVDGKLLRLKFDKLHEGMVRKADFYVSCADFVDQSGRKVDVDMLVRRSAGKLILEQALAQLRSIEREALFLAVVEGYTAQEIADLTQQGRGTVLSLIHGRKLR